tara:strand:+ start:3833 stop:5389 length:1557 start_codon:yes stop_codon:yes gene_type:complete
MSKILGIFGGSHNASASYVKDGEIICCYEEERLVRVKSGNDFGRNPDLAVKRILEENGLSIEDFDDIAVAAPICNGFVKGLGVDESKVTVVNHHACHAYGAYLTSGFKEKTIVVSYDGGGDKDFGRIYLAEDNKLNLIKSIPLWSAASAGQMYAHTTVCLGWKMLKDEGKVTGLAAHGKYDESLYRKLNKIFYYNNNFSFSPGDSPGKTALLLNKLNLPDASLETKSKVAHNVQLVIENEFCKLLNHLNSIYPEYKKVILVGGLFANVKLNQKINETPWVEEVFVFPPMGDEGLSLGAALTLAYHKGERKTKRLENVFFGSSYSNDDIQKAGLKFHRDPYSPDRLAEMLDSGKIIGWFQGRFEHGPRALGARSIIVKATDPDTHKNLNERLKRHEIMPFAPFVKYDKANEIFNIEKSHMTSEFMTMCYSTKPEWVDKIPAVVHKCDGTARPQLVYPDRNKKFYEVLDSYDKISNIPVLLNTSFNGHGEPIIDSPAEAFAHLESGMIDALVAEDFIYFK